MPKRNRGLVEGDYTLIPNCVLTFPEGKPDDSVTGGLRGPSTQSRHGDWSVIPSAPSMPFIRTYGLMDWTVLYPYHSLKWCRITGSLLSMRWQSVSPDYQAW